MINVNGLKRNAKNLVKKYSDAQIKVREATSNDPWGPSSTIMAEIADLTYNVMAFSEIMQMIWKRLNDHGKNWRHVYKALVLLEYLIKTGTEKVAQQCRDNICAIETLKTFQYMEENKDLGMSVREKSKALVSLLKDPEKLESQRARALKAKQRFSESMSFTGRGSSHSSTDTPTHSSDVVGFHDSSSGPSSSAVEITSPEIEQARPQTATEEETQLQLALAISKEEAEQQEKLRKHDDLRLKLALGASQKEVSSSSTLSAVPFGATSSPSSSSSSSRGVKAGSLNSVTGPSASSQNNSSSTTVDDLLGLNTTQPEPFDLWKNNSGPVPPPVSSNNIVDSITASSNGDSLFAPWKSPPATATQPETNFDPWKMPVATPTTPFAPTTMATSSSSTLAATAFDAWKPVPSLPTVASSSMGPNTHSSMTRTDDLNNFDPWSVHPKTQPQQLDPWKPKPVSKNPFAD